MCVAGRVGGAGGAGAGCCSIDVVDGVRNRRGCGCGRCRVDGVGGADCSGCSNGADCSDGCSLFVGNTFHNW